MRLVDLELDLDVFAGPFDLLLTLVLREEIDLLEVDLADVVISYIDHLEHSPDGSGANGVNGAKGAEREELDLEAATEFLVLIAALLELKSRLMLPGEETEELIELAPGEAAEELLARLLDAHRYRLAATMLGQRLDEQSGYRFREAPLPPSLRRAALPAARAVYEPELLGAAIGRLLTPPVAVDTRHVSDPKVTVSERLAVLRALLRRGSFSFRQAIERADRVTIAVTLFALLELYKQGEASWSQEEPFGEIRIEACRRQAEAPARPEPLRAAG